MARINFKFHVQTLPILSSSPLTTSFLVFLAIVSAFSIVSFLCGSHKKPGFNKGKTEHLGEKKAVVKMQSNISSKALLLAKMISWKKKKVEDEETKGRYDNDYDEDDEEEEDDEEAIWKKGIIKGEKCRPLDFSGKILYDADGNRLPDSPQPSQ